MNRLPLERRAQIVGLLAEGNSLRAASRLADVSINTVTKLLLDVGKACEQYQHKTLRNLTVSAHTAGSKPSPGSRFSSTNAGRRTPSRSARAANARNVCKCSRTTLWRMPRSVANMYSAVRGRHKARVFEAVLGVTAKTPTCCAALLEAAGVGRGRNDDILEELDPEFQKSLKVAASLRLP